MKRGYRVLFMSVASFSALIAVLCLATGFTPFFLRQDSQLIDYNALPTKEDWETIDKLYILADNPRLAFSSTNTGQLDIEPYTNEVRSTMSFEGTSLYMDLSGLNVSSVSFALPDENKNYSIYITTTGGIVDISKARLAVLEVEGYNPSINIDDLTAESVSLRAMLGKINIIASNIGLLKANNPAGKINLSALVNDILLETRSGDISFTPQGNFRRADINTASGDVTLTFPRNLGLLIEYRTLDGSISGDFPLSKEGVGTFAYGSATTFVKINTDSGSTHVNVAKDSESD